MIVFEEGKKSKKKMKFEIEDDCPQFEIRNKNILNFYFCFILVCDVSYDDDDDYDDEKKKKKKNSEDSSEFSLISGL